MTILDEAVTGLQNIYTPFTPKQHLVFCIFGTAIYLIQFYRRGGWHNLLLMLGIDLTYLTQTSLCNTSDTIWILGVAEIIVLGAAFFFSYKFNKQQKALKAAGVTAETPPADDEARSDTITKEAAEKDADIVDNAFEE
ncbi:MAG: hypothetical protein K6B74_10310 [Ruminococcus sp.]|nr:hypothetical protein [Ruminococcus sp.]